MPAERAAPSEQGAPVATGTGPLPTTTVVELLDVAADGEGRERRQFVPADRVRAGDEVYYTIRVQNPGRTPVGNVVVTKQLPFGMHYVRSSAVGPAAEIEFSVDGGESFGAARRPAGPRHRPAPPAGPASRTTRMSAGACGRR